MKDKTLELLAASRTRRRRYPKRVLLYGETKEGKRLQGQLTKARRAIADKLRGIRQTDGHRLARVWARAAN